jgi:tetratricopeptide (TPR) repeat protein
MGKTANLILILFLLICWISFKAGSVVASSLANIGMVKFDSIRHIKNASGLENDILDQAKVWQGWAELISPHQQNVFRLRARLAAIDPQIGDSTSVLKQYVDHYPSDLMMWFELGLAEIKRDDVTSGIISFRKANSAMYFFNHANYLYFEKKDITGAENALEIAVKINPNFAAAYGMLGEVYYTLGDPRAQTSLETALSLSDDKAIVVASSTRLGDILASDRQWKQSIKFYEDALKQEPDNVHALTGMGRSIYHLTPERIAEAVAIEMRAVRLDPGYPWSYWSLAEIYKLDGNSQESMYWYSLAKAYNQQIPEP